jgi:DNA (cytosine-5)-methyltransferase 1
MSAATANLTLVGSVTSISAAKAAGRPKFIEFFAGIGLARMGLERAGFVATWANDYELDKKRMYLSQFGEKRGHRFALGDIAAVDAGALPTDAALAWASSPCTDLSLAGARAGLAGSASGTFWHFVRLLDELGGRRPPVVVLENVTGLATSHGGDDLCAAISAFNELGYSVDVLALDARRFVPQSRPRMFVVGALNPPTDTAESNLDLRPEYLQWVYGDPKLRTHRAALPAPPAPLTSGLSALVEEVPQDDERWWDAHRTAMFTASLSALQTDRLAELQRSPEAVYRTAYRRTRGGVPVWEVRADDISGCLRTARGGSSKQAIVRVDEGGVRVRWMTPLEYARLMGAEEYNLSDARTNQSLFGFGDAVAVPVVEWLGRHYLLPLIRGELAFGTPGSSLAANV